ncbi:hypothetical protein BJY52DRAFT_1227874 [Lactarius psammicola]|nr:hypothetical protein BJY52DRAFT_1227874 [Lactarius psammicola]
MIGATPTFYDPEQDTQPQAQDYQRWIDNSYGQSQLVYSNTPSYPPQPSVSDSRTQRQMQSQAPRHTNHYQFVTSHHQPPPPPPSSDAAQYGFFENPQNQTFDSRLASTQRPSRVASNWPQQPSAEFHQPPPSSDDAAWMDQYHGIPDTHQQQQQHQYSSPAEYLTPGVALTPASDATLQSGQSISPAWTDNQPLPPHGTGLSNTPTGSVTFQRSPKQPGKRTPGKTKQRKRQKSDTDTDDDDDVVEANVGANMPRPNRLPGACTYCKRLKMKCTFPPGENVCKRCKTGKHDCIVEGRKPRSAPNKREYLLAQMKQKDAIIESLLKQLHNPYLATPLSIEAYRMATPSSDHHRDTVIAWLDRLQSSVRSPPVRSGPAKNPFQLETRDSEESDDEQTQQPQQQHMTPRRGSSGTDDSPVSPNTLVEADIDAYADDAVPIGLLANLAISTSKDRPAVSAEKKGKENADDEDDNDVGVASRQFFMPGPSQNLALRKSLIDKISPPDILVHKLVTPEDVEKLFDIFYTRINPFISLLEPKLHTPALTFSRCPFLFTVVCAIASRYSDKPEVYPIAMHFAKSAAANALVDGWKNLSNCGSLFGTPPPSLSAASGDSKPMLNASIATDLNLHLLPQKKPTTEQQELEMLNRTRIWIICFNLDKSTATQFGKPSTLKEDYFSIMRHSLEWYKASTYNHCYDVHIIAYSSLFRIINQFHQKVFSDPDVPNGLNRSIDFREVTLSMTNYCDNCRESGRALRARFDHNDAACEFRLHQLCEASHVFVRVQKAFQRGFQADDEVFFLHQGKEILYLATSIRRVNHLFFPQSLDSAKTVCYRFVDTLLPTGYIRFAPDGYFVFAGVASGFMLSKLLRPEGALGFITPGARNRDISTIDERSYAMLLLTFLGGALLVNILNLTALARGRMHQQGQPTQQPQASIKCSSSCTSNSRDKRPPNNKHTAQTRLRSQHKGGGGNPTTVQDVVPPHSITLNGKPTVTANNNEPIHQFEAPPGDVMDFTFDSMISIDDLLGPMKAIENPHWMQTMMLPGFSWPTDESYTFFGNNMATDGYQNFMPPAPQPTAVHLG